MYHILLFHFNAPLLNIFENLLFMAFTSSSAFLFISTQHSDSNILKAMKRHRKRFTIFLFFCMNVESIQVTKHTSTPPSFTVYLLSSSSTFPNIHVSFDRFAVVTVQIKEICPFLIEKFNLENLICFDPFGYFNSFKNLILKKFRQCFFQMFYNR